MPDTLLSIPNISEGRDVGVIAAVRRAYESAGAVVLDEHSDRDHGRSVHTIVGTQGQLSEAISSAWCVARDLIDLRAGDGVHPHVGVLDVAPIVHLNESQRGAACAEALASAGRLGREGASVFLYGILGGGRTRSEIRIGGVTRLAERVSGGELRPDFGPTELSPRSGAVLCAARPPLVAFNVLLAEQEPIELARSTASAIRQSAAEGLAGVRALAFELRSQGRVQLSFNLERPREVGIPEVVAFVRARHEVSSGELIGLAQRSVIARIPSDLAMPGFDPDLRSVEGCLRFHGITD